MSETQLTPINAFRKTLEQMRDDIRSALPPQIPAERFIRTLITTVQMNPELLECEKKSLLAAAMKSAQDGLLMDGREAAPVIYRNHKDGTKTCTYIPMVGGLLKKARNSGEIKDILAEAVYEKDLFNYELGESPKIEHKPFWGEDRGPVVAFYAVVKTKDGGTYRKVMSKGDVDAIKARSKAKFGPWLDFYVQMGIKTVIKSVLKICPQSSDLESLIEYDNENTGVEFKREEKTVIASAEPTDLLSKLGAPTEQAPIADKDKDIDDESPFGD